MATQNIAIPTGVGSSYILSLAAHAFEYHAQEIANGIIGKNFLLSYLKKKGQLIIGGGLDFAFPILIGENSNISWSNRYAQSSGDVQDPVREFRYDPVVLKGPIVANKLDTAQCSGEAQIKNLVKTLKLQAETTVENQLNKAFWATSPVANVEPSSIPSLISATPTVGSIGGITRSGNTYAQNKAYTTAITSVGAAAGLARLHAERAKLGGSAKVVPDFALTTATIYGLVHGYLDTLRQARADESMMQLGFETVMVGPAVLGYDGDGGTGECPSNYFYYLNSKFLKFVILREMNFVFEPFSYKDNSINATSMFHLGCNLCCGMPNGMEVFTGISG